MLIGGTVLVRLRNSRLGAEAPQHGVQQTLAPGRPAAAPETPSSAVSDVQVNASASSGGRRCRHTGTVRECRIGVETVRRSRIGERLGTLHLLRCKPNKCAPACEKCRLWRGRGGQQRGGAHPMSQVPREDLNLSATAPRPFRRRESNPLRGLRRAPGATAHFKYTVATKIRQSRLP